MAVTEFSEYTYKISYKENITSLEEIILSEELRIIEAKTNIIDGSGASVEAPNPNYDFFMTTLRTNISPVDNVILFIRRNVVKDGENIISEEETVYTGSFNFLNYDRRIGIVFTDSKVGESKPYKILAQILNVNAIERIPCKYVFTGVDFNILPDEVQHIDVAYKQTDSDEYIPIGTNMEVPSSGIVDGIELGELPDDTKYIIKVYHREQEQEKLFMFRTNIVPSIGCNPIIGIIEWNGRIMLLDAPGIKARMYPGKDDVDWMFPMDYSTKSFDNILSSLWTSDGYQTNKEDYHFVMRTSTDNETETYVGCEVTNDYYIGLPIDYVNEKLPDQGASMNIHFKDLFVVDDNNADRNIVFIKFYIDANHEGPVKLFNFSDNTTEKYIGIDVSGSTFTFNAFGTTTNLSGIQRGKWYTLVLVCRTKYIVYASITDYSNYSQVLLPVGAGATIGNVDSKAKLYDGARLPVTVELTYNAILDAADDNMGICIDWATFQYIENDVGNNQIEKGKSDYQVISTGNNKQLTFTCPNEAGYGFAVGYSIAFLQGGVTTNGTITITGLKVNGVSVFVDVASYPFSIDSSVNQYMNGSRTTIIFFRTGSSIASPVGGVILSNIPLNGTIDDNAQPFMGKPLDNNMNTSSYVISRVGLRKTKINGTDSWRTPYQYLDVEVFEALGGGYKKCLE